MQYTPTVIFQNEGLLDPIAIGTFGVNAKNDDSAIGYFGTGLKYAIAVLLREKHEIVICSGNNVYEFTLNTHALRGKEFNVVTMNGQPLGFTTELGKDWELWQAFRELYCNALDECGMVDASTDGTSLRHEQHLTTIYVKGKPFYDAYLERDSIVLSTHPIASAGIVGIHPGESSYVYYKGVRALDLQKPSMHTFNINTHIGLTEDRTIRHSFMATDAIANALMRLDDPKLIEHSILAHESYMESELKFHECICPSEAALSTAEKNRLNPRLNKTIHLLLKAHNRSLPLPPIELNEIQKKQLQRAVKFCRDIGYMVDNYPIVCTTELKGGMHGLAENETIYIAPQAFNIGTKYVASTILEEYFHLQTGFGDMTRDLQTYLFDAILTLGEKYLGEPI